MPSQSNSFEANVAARLGIMASQVPNAVAIASPLGSPRQGTRRRYKTLSFADLDAKSTSIAAGMQGDGIGPGKRIALLVRFGEEFITLVFAILKTGATMVLIDPGMGRSNLLDSLAATNPDGFVAIPQGHVARLLFRRRFPNAKLNIMVGRDFGLFRLPTMNQLESTPASRWSPPSTTQESEAAIIYTTGSTGPPKGVLYTHSTFNNQIDQLVEHYEIVPGGKDLSGFPLFGLFNAVMGTTTILPDMDPTRPADVDPVRLLDAIDQWNVDQAFGSPALWNRIGKYCHDQGRRCESLKRVLSAGAPVPPRVLAWMRAAAHPEAQIYTPYGATEALPVASIESREVLGETAEKCRQGKGTCVGKKFHGIEWQVIGIEDGPLRSIEETKSLPRGTIGELMVRGKVVTAQYVTRTDQNELHKVQDGDTFWHRMGDVGYLDEQDRFWFCGRKSHRVQTGDQVLYTEPCEAIINTHPAVYRSALVGIGESQSQTPVMIVEPWPEKRPTTEASRSALLEEIQALSRSQTATETLQTFLIYPEKLPTDIRHNSKIFREKLRPWAESQLGIRS